MRSLRFVAVTSNGVPRERPPARFATYCNRRSSRGAAVAVSRAIQTPHFGMYGRPTIGKFFYPSRPGNFSHRHAAKAHRFVSCGDGTVAPPNEERDTDMKFLPWIVHHPRRVIALTLLLVVVAAAGLAHLQQLRTIASISTPTTRILRRPRPCKRPTPAATTCCS